jgi:hypothetical protein
VTFSNILSALSVQNHLMMTGVSRITLIRLLHCYCVFHYQLINMGMTEACTRAQEFPASANSSKRRDTSC